MNKKRMTFAVFVMMIVSMIYIFATGKATELANASGVLTSSQKSCMETIAQTAIDNYETYGILPSVCLAQAMQESSLGVHRPSSDNYNCYGHLSGKLHYSSYQEATIAHIGKVLGNGRYDGALFNKDYESSLYAVQNGGYCAGAEGNVYASNCISHIKRWGFDKYDKELFRILEKKEIKKLRRQEFDVIIDKSLPECVVYCNKKLVGKCNTVTVYSDNVLVGIYELKKANVTTAAIKINNSDLKGKVTMKFYNAKG